LLIALYPTDALLASCQIGEEVAWLS
jgi:hypothetical protein